MKLFEEYLARNKIDVPVAIHCSSGSVLLKNSPNTVWDTDKIFCFKWIEHSHHPGQYKIELLSPIHDGYRNDEVFRKDFISLKKWEEYESCILHHVEEFAIDLQPVEGELEVVLAAWEIFVFVYDGWFIKQPSEVKKLLFESLDKENSLTRRFKHFQSVILYLSSRHPHIMYAWKYEVLSRLKNYSNWLVALINNQKQTLELKNESKV